MTTQEFVTFRICDQMFGVSVSEIHDVFRPAAMTPFPFRAQKSLASLIFVDGSLRRSTPGRVWGSHPNKIKDLPAFGHRR